MKLSVSTIGCPDWDWARITEEAARLGLDGVEVRGVGSQLYAPRAPVFQAAQLAETRRVLAEKGLAIPVLTSGAALGVGDADLALDEARDYVELAARLGVPYVRVLICGSPEPGAESAEQCAASYASLCAYAQERGVTPILETNGVLGDSAAMARFLEGIPSENKGVLWDVHHPYRFFRETPERTYKNIGKWVRHVHVKDSVLTKDGLFYRLLGEGDVPVFSALRLLTENAYAGYISLEWVKRWCPELQEPESVFAQYLNYMRVKLRKLG